MHARKRNVRHCGQNLKGVWFFYFKPVVFDCFIHFSTILWFQPVHYCQLRIIYTSYRYPFFLYLQEETNISTYFSIDFWAPFNHFNIYTYYGTSFSSSTLCITYFTHHIVFADPRRLGMNLKKGLFDMRTKLYKKLFITFKR